jgi:hypothetical protein
LLEVLVLAVFSTGLDWHDTAASRQRGRIVDNSFDILDIFLVMAKIR